MKYFVWFLLFGTFLITSACVDDDFDTPEPIPIPDSNATIADVLALYDEEVDVIISEELTFEATVISSDEAGNIFENLYVQDETGGIVIRIDANDLFNDFPYLSTVVVATKDLKLTSFNDIIQLDGLTEANFKRHVFFKSLSNDLEIPTKRLSEITLADAPSIVRIDSIEFSSVDIFGTFGDDSGETGVNRNFQDCDGNTVTTRISNFSDFANQSIFMGNGSGTFVVTRFGQTLQLAFGTLDDLNFNGERCDGIEPNTTIAEVKALFGGTTRTIDTDLFLEATVVSSDESGNIFETIYLQDETGGITLALDDVRDSYQNAPYFSKVIVKLNGLTLRENNDLLVVEGITENNFTSNVGVISLESDLTIETKRLDELSFNDVPMMMNIEDVQFSGADVGGGYGSSSGSGVNRMIEDCNDNSIICRINNFSDFARQPIAGDNGAGTFILSRFRDDLQLVFNDPSFLDFNGERCRISGGGDIIPIADLRAQWSNGETMIPDMMSIQGMVISDFENENITGRNLVLQDDSGAGIVLRFGDFHSFALGDVIEVAVGGKELSEFNGLLQISDLNLNAVIPSSAPIDITPRILTVGDILSDFENVESSLVRVNGAMLSGGATLNNSNQGIDVNDGTGTITLFTTSFASFANAAVPATADIIAYVSQGGNESEMQLSIRNLSDLIGERPDAVDEFFEDFQTAQSEENISINGWSTVSVEGSRMWWGQDFDGNVYAQATAFRANDSEIETWLISPEFDHTVDKILQFVSAQAFYVHDGLSVWMSTDYDGSNFPSANWSPITGAMLAGSSSEDNEWIPSGEVVLSSTGGTAYIAFRYEGNPNNGTTPYRIDDVSLQNR